MSEYDKDPLEAAVIMRILAEGSIKRAESLGLKEYHFSDPTNNDAFSQIRKHSRRRATLGQTPSTRYMKKLCPHFPLNTPVPEEKLSELIGDMLTNALKRELQATIEDTTHLLKGFRQPSMALDYLAKKVREMAQDTGAPTHVKVDLPLGLKTALDNYDEVKRGGGMLGPAWPWEPLNLITQGMKNGNLYIFYAPSKHGKTWTVLFAMIWAFLQSNCRVLIVTTEMPAEEVWERIACILARVCNRRYQRGDLTPLDEQRLRDTIELFRAEDYNALIDSEQDISESNHRSIRVVNGMGAGIQMVKDEIEEYEPDLVFVDGIYNVASGDQNHAHVKKAIADMKQVAIDYNVPISATAQTNRSGWVKLEDLETDSYKDIGMSSGIIFYADCIIRIHRFCAGVVNNVRTFKQFLNVPAGRRDFTEPWIINFAPGYDLGLYAVGVTPAEAASWAEEPEIKEADSGDEDEPDFGGGGGFL